jgi:hypothetical protein
MHEVGHTLSCATTSVDRLHGGATRDRIHGANGISGSVMEYNLWNLAVKGEKQGESR